MVMVIEKVADVGVVDAGERDGMDASVSVADLARFADIVGDLADSYVMSQAWH